MEEETALTLIDKHLGAIQSIFVGLATERDNLLGLAINLLVELGKTKIVLDAGDFEFAKEYGLFIELDDETKEVTITLRKIEGGKLV